MPELGEGWAAAVKGGIAGALQPLQAERKNYLAYLDDRSKSVTPADAYQELVELTDRGLFGPEDVMLDTFTIAGNYTASLQETEGGDVKVAIGAALPALPINGSIGLDASLQRQSNSSGNLQMSATYRTRPRADFLQASKDALPPRPVAAASDTPKG